MKEVFGLHNSKKLCETQGSYMKKIIVILLLFCALPSLFAQKNNEPYILYYMLMPWDVDPIYIQEYTFSNNGLLKSITYYDINECIDYYRWDEIKDKSKILKKYEIIRDEDKVTEYLSQNGNKQVFKEIFLDKNLLKNKSKGIKYWIIDDILMQIFREEGWPNTPYVPFTIEFDNKNVYTVIYPSIDGFPYESKEVFFVSEHINFTEQTAILNELLNPINPYSGFIFSEAVIPREEYSYKNGNGSMSLSKNSLKISQNGNIIDLKDFSITDSFGMEYIYNDGKKQGLLLKNSDFVIYYRSNDKAPFFIGYNPEKDKTITEPDNLCSSSYLKETSVIYKPENLKTMKLKEPWAEGVAGNGIGEYIQFDKSDANGLYIVNGYVSMDRPDLYEKNSRVKELTVTGLTSGITQEEYLLDSAKPQYISLKAFQDETIRITIKSVYEGTKYTDTCISGLVLIK